MRLAAGDTVTCTYTDRLTPPPAGLVINKVTLGGVGTFSWDVTPAAGGGVEPRHGDRRPSEDVATAGYAATSSLEPAPTGSRRTSPTPTGGAWSLAARHAATGRSSPTSSRSPSRSAPDEGASCTFTNRFTPDGTIRIRKKTIGAVGTAGFVITPLFGEARSYEQSATTTTENVAVLATGDDTSR